MGSFYRSKHELIFVFLKGGGKHVNNFGLGEHGRYRTNVWDYPGISSIGPNRAQELAMIADAIRDCSKHHDIVLDCFGGSGSTLIAAERTRRRGFLIEYEPAYCDTTIARWEKFTGGTAIHQPSGRSFNELAAERRTGPAAEEGGAAELTATASHQAE